VKLSALLNYEGGIIDDLTVYKKANDSYMLVTNAVTKDRDLQWIQSIQQDKKFECNLKNISDKTGKIDLQGPRAEEILQTLIPDSLNNLRFYHFFESTVSGIPSIISRSGYTGEDGFEIYASADKIGDIWDKFMSTGDKLGIKPAGLGARDTLRLEAGMLLNGQDMSESVSPLEVPYTWLIDWNKEFIGSAVLEAQKNTGIKKKLVGMEMTGRGIARHGYKIFDGKKEIGVVTSGTFSPTLNKAIGLAFIDIAFSVLDTEILIDIRNSMNGAKIVKMPFYKREKK